MYLLHTYQNNPAFFYVSMGLLGLLVGSFLNVVIYRLPIMMQREWDRECRLHLGLEFPKIPSKYDINLISPRSRCPQCGHKITALENIPLLSYILLKGKCSQCLNPISIRYPVVEFATAVITFVVAWHYNFSLQAIYAAILSWSLISLCMIDFDHQLLPDNITLPFLWLGVLLNLFGIFTDIQSSIIGAMAGYISLWLVYIIFKTITGKEGMGHGDFKLLAMLGAWIGWQMLPLTVILSSICGTIVGVSLILFKSHDKATPIPFGPYMAIAGWISMLWGNDILRVYSTWAYRQ